MTRTAEMAQMIRKMAKSLGTDLPDLDDESLIRATTRLIQETQKERR